jgi:hypothetical protein
MRGRALLAEMPIAGHAGGILLRRALTLSLALLVAFNAVLAQDRIKTFSIPAQPLADALYAFSSVTGIEILVPGDVVAGRQSSGVTGTLAPETALHVLLSKTGLVPRYTGQSAFTLVPAAAQALPTTARMPRYPAYSGALQAAVTNILCHLPETRPGTYRVAARLWVGRSGAVTRVSVLGTTGDARRDAALSELLGHVVLDEPPPDGLRQPTTVLILPRGEKTAECLVSDAGVGRD